MDEINFMEQPETNTAQTVDVGEQNTQEINHEEIEDLQSGSNQFGKFKDATTLFEAYNNLQKEFTKKSQQLSSILKNQNNTLNSENIDKNKENINNLHSESGKNAVFQKNENQNKNDFAYKKSDWTTKAISFLNSKDDAKNYSSDIAKLLMEDKALAQSPNCLEYAYAIVKSKNYKEPAAYLTDQNFLETNIYNNDMIKDKIIEDYLSNAIGKRKTNVKVITGQAENVSLTPPADKPKNLKEASLILTKLLQK